MQRVLSLETSRCTDTSGEFVSKRLCISFLFTIAFFTLLGGYLLGRYTADRASIIKKKTVLEDIRTENLKSVGVVTALSEMITKLNNATKAFAQLQENSDNDYKELYEKLHCEEKFVEIPSQEQFKKSVSVQTNKIIYNQLKSLENCYKTVNDLLEQYITDSKNSR